MLGFGRSIILARLLPIEVFGIYALASSITSLTAPIASFCTGSAFLHRSEETQDEDYAAAIQFTLRLITTSLWIISLIIVGLVFTEGDNRVALCALAVIRGAAHLTETAKMILNRRVVHRRLAILQLVDATVSIVTIVAMAWFGATLWALLSGDIITLIVNCVGLYIWRPVWRPHLAWEPKIVRYYLSFGSRTLLATLLSRALDRVDDLWTGIFLGNTPLSFYARAYRFATYPRSILANPILAVTRGTYAELKEKRLQLSKAFFRVNALLIRSGFLLAGLLALVAPEFIRLLLGERWLPMLDAFRLMLVFTLFDPIKLTVGNLFVAVGKPELVVKARAIQLIVLVIGLFSLGLNWSISGVAVAVDIMLVVGIAILLWQARTYVDFSLGKLIGAPVIALILALILGLSATTLPRLTSSDWISAIAKTTVFSAVYLALLLILERRQFIQVLRFIHDNYR